MHRQGCKGKLNYTNTLAADLNWARQGLGGRMKQDRKYSSQMEKSRGQRSGVNVEKRINGKSGRCVRGEKEESLCSPLSSKTH